MPKSSPLQAAQKEAEGFKKKVDDALSECQTKVDGEDKINPDDKKTKKLYKKCSDLMTAGQKVLDKLEKCAKDKEPSGTEDFDIKKDAEMKRIKNEQNLLQKMMNKLNPAEAKDVMESSKEEEEEDEEEDEEYESGDEEEEESGEEEEYEEGEEEEVEVEEEEEEVEDEESGEEVGDEEGEEEEEEEEEAEEEEEEEDVMNKKFQAINDYTAEQPDDLGFKAGDILTVVATREDGWWEAEDSTGKKGMVPSTYLQMYTQFKELMTQEPETPEADDGKGKKSAKQLWKGIRSAINETSVTDVLHAMGAIPSGFRPCTLIKYKENDPLYAEIEASQCTYIYLRAIFGSWGRGSLKLDAIVKCVASGLADHFTMKNYLAPKLSTSNLFYRDLFYNPTQGKIRARSVRTQRIIQLQACRQIPLPGTGVDVVSRHVRVCLFDGENILSNIHCVRAMTTDKEQKVWGFNNKTNDQAKTFDFGEFFIRTNGNESNLGLLFEISVRFLRAANNEENEMSCGWAHLPLFEANGAPVPNKTFDLLVNGGTPFEKGVEVEANISRKDSIGRRYSSVVDAKSSAFRTLMSGTKQPRFIVKIFQPNKEQKENMDTLPDVVVGSTLHIPFLSFYRQVLADELLRDRVDIESTEIIHSPLLATFPTAVDQPDIMDALRALWLEKFKAASRAAKRDSEQMKELFMTTYMDSVYPLLNVSTLPPLIPGSKKNEEFRQVEIQKVMRLAREKQSILASLLSPDIPYKPFNINEISFDVISPFCIVK